MDESEFAREIVRAWSVLKDNLQIGRALICAVSLQIDEVVKDVSLSEDSTYEQIFRTGLSRSNYNILTEDYSYFQFSWSDGNSWRLSYYPNPWLSGVASAEDRMRHWEMLEEIGALSYEQVSDLLDDMPYQGAVPPIRFEYAPEQYRELTHPAAHFHIGRHTENRWPSAVILRPVTFTLVIAKMYYPNAWAVSSKLHGASVRECIDERLLIAMADVRAVHDFSDKERRSLHFGKHISPQEPQLPTR